MKKKFIFEKTVYLSDTNAEGNVYFAKFFEWQGQAREEFFKKIRPNFLQEGIKLITVEAYSKYLHECRLFDEVEIIIKISQLRKASIKMNFTFINKKTKEKVAEGYQIIAYADIKGKIERIPPEIREKLAEFLE